MYSAPLKKKLAKAEKTIYGKLVIGLIYEKTRETLSIEACLKDGTRITCYKTPEHGLTVGYQPPRFDGEKILFSGEANYMFNSLCSIIEDLK